MKVKKMMSALLAGGMLALSMLPIGANAAAAATYNSGDANRDGSVEHDDSLLIYQVLSARVYRSNPAVLDADRNLIVSDADAACITNYLMIGGGETNVDGSTTKFGIGTSTATSSPASISQKYVVFNYETGKEEKTYTLSLSQTEQVGSTASPDSIVDGKDDRIVQNGMDGIVYLDSGATGFIVGDHEIATAAHCVYKLANKSWKSKMKIHLPDKYGIADTSTTLTPVSAHIPYEYKQTIDVGGYKYDYALITVKEDLRQYSHFSLGIPYNYTSATFKEYNIYVTGYPAELQEDDGSNTTVSPKRLYTGRGKIKGFSNNLLRYNTDTSGGNSGSPVYVKELYTLGGRTIEQNTVIGIHVAGGSTSNGCVPIDGLKLKFFLNNPNT